MAYKSPEAQAEYRRRKAAGLIPDKVDPLLSRPVVPWTDEQRAVATLDIRDRCNRCLAAWLLNQNSRNTREAYRRDWQAWVEWCGEVQLSWLEPDRNQGRVWVAAMTAEGLSSATIRRRVAGVRAALLELYLDGLRVTGDPFLGVRLPKVGDASTTVPLTDDEVHRALDAARGLSGRHETLVLSLATMGLRAGEAAQLSAQTVRMSPWGMVADIVGKGSKEALVPVPGVVLDAARVDGWPCEGYKANRDRITYLVGQVAERAGLELHPHQFRHWHATVALREGVELAKVQDSLRHSDPKTTQRYNRARTVVEGHSAFTIAGVIERDGL